MKKKLLIPVALTAALSLFSGASACTAFYAGSALTDDGAVIFSRSEDISNSYNKLFYVSPAANHKAGEEYRGCYGFTYTFAHDSYSYTAFRDDNGEGVEGVCPDCGGTHVHTPYEAAGTNEMGGSVTATETIHSSEEVYNVDPYEDLGIEEAEIVTVLLSEAATAREAVDLLLGIYDTAGANNGSGILIGDSSETWYVENVTGHAYIALKLSDSMILVQPNMSIIGLIDLDDTENVIASANLISVAQEAGTFVGSAEDNAINYILSYNGSTQPNARMINALEYLDTPWNEESGEINYLISNVDENGDVVPMYTGFKAEGPITIERVQAFYKIPSIGYQRNLETHIFQVYPEGEALGTVEWICMNDAAINVFVPYYPMLTLDVDESYKLSTAPADFSEEAPEGRVYYPTTVNRRVNGERVQVEGFMAVPENWADSMYWTYDALSNLISYAGVSDEAAQAVLAALEVRQAEINAAFAAFKATVAAESDPAAAATAFSMEAAGGVHALGVELTESIK